MASKHNKIQSILKSPLLKRVALLLVVILLLVGIVKLFTGKKANNEDIIGYQKLVNVSDEGVYTYVDLEGKTKTYDGYKTMSDFYYNVTNVSRLNEKDNSITEYALINKKGRNVVKFGTYENIIQVLGGKYYKVLKDNKFGVVDYEGKKVIDINYDYISVITGQDGNEVLFECQSGDTYDFVNENGNVFLTTNTSQHTVSYKNSLNDTFDTVIKIGVDSENKYFNLKTGEELFVNEQIISFTYNILKQTDKITIFNKDYKKSVVIDVSQDYSADARAYFNKYVLVEQKNVSTGSKAYKYTVYDQDLKAVLESDNKINIIQAASGEIYFLTNEGEGVKITDEDKKSKTVKGYEFTSNSISDLQAILLNKIGDTSYASLFNFKGKLIEEKVTDYYFKASSLKVSSEGKSYLIFTNKSKYELIDQDSVSSIGDYLVVENLQEGTTTVVSLDGKVIMDRVLGTRIFYNKKYIGLQESKTVTIYDLQTGKKTLSYQIDEYVDRDETANYVELTTGYYFFNGKKIIK